MNALLKRRLLILASSQLIILAISFICFHEISLLSYINISFYISAALLFTSLLIFIMQTGFFDTISKSFNLSALRGKNKRNFHEIPSLSEMVTVNKQPLLFYGLSIGLFMIIALIAYYV